MGLRTICFAWEDGAVCKEIADKFYPISIVEKEQILDICRQEQIDGVCTIASDVAAPTVAYVAERMGLSGNSYECALRANNKFLMRQALTKAGIPCPQFGCVKDNASLADILANISSFKFPLIVKPSDRSGSLGVVKVENENELLPAVTSAQNYSFKHEAMVEQYIDGREISVEFISYKGIHYPLQITDKVTTGAPRFVELEHHQPADLPPELYSEIYSVTQQALSALGITDGASHSEYRITEDGQIYIMEIGARMGGDFIGSDLVQLSTGYDYLKGVIEVALGTFKEPQTSAKAYSGVYFLCKETEKILPLIQSRSLPQIVSSAITNEHLQTPACSSERSGYLIYQYSQKLSL